MSFGMVASSYVPSESTSLWLNRTVLSGSSVDPNGTASHTCTFTPAASGSLLVATITGGVTSTMPAGWSLLASAIHFNGLYVFTKVASAGEDAFTTTHNGTDFPIRGIVYEFPGSTTVLGSNAGTVGEGDISEPSVMGLAGTYAAFAVRSHSLTTTSGTWEIAWTTPATEDYEASFGGAGNGLALAVAYQEAMTDAVFSPAYHVTWENTGASMGEGVVFALMVS